MPSLQKADDRFMHRIEIIENGSGFFKGLIDEPQQGSPPIFQFVNGRRVLRVNPAVPILPRMVIRTQGGGVFIVAELGDNEGIFQSFRLIETTGRYAWKTRGKTIDPITQLEEDTGPQNQGMIWGSYEPAATEMFDRQMRTSFETARFVTNALVHVDDIVDNKRVARADRQLGVSVLTLG